MSDNNWLKLHKIYESKDWVNQPSIFATQAIDYFPKEGMLLELGAGVGQDSVYFAKKGYTVTSTDLSTDALAQTIQKKDSAIQGHITIKTVDLRSFFEFEDNSFDIVYAHLSLHYFNDQITKQIFTEIYRVLKKGGILAFFTNSINDPEYSTGEKIEDNFFVIDGVNKRYLSKTSAGVYAKGFHEILLDEDGETYKDMAVGVHNLVRYVGKK